MNVQQDSAVLLHMELLLADGSVAESSRAIGKPMKFQLGDGSLSPAIESELIGLAAGAKKRFSVSAEDGFGPREPALLQYMQRQDFPADILLEVGAILAFKHPSGGEMPGVIREIAGESVTVDFNHPLAGEALTFDIEVLSIES